VSFVKVRAHDPRGEFWQGYEWSKWEALATAKAPQRQGIYRVLAGRERRLLYIGISGNLYRRLYTLRRGVIQGLKVAHPAVACVRQHWSVIKVSWVVLEEHETERRELFGIEAELIAAYRSTLHESPTCQWSGRTYDD